MKLKLRIPTSKLLVVVPVLALAATASSAQVASHAPVAAHAPVATAKAPEKHPARSVPVSTKLVARVNGAVLTDLDLVREMYAIFPYARQHNGFPKSMEADIRQGALQMLIFEELVYQDAVQRKVAVPAEKLAAADIKFRKQFPDQASFQQFLQAEYGGSRAALREKIRRSLLIDQVLRSEVNGKAKVTLDEAKAFYDKNPKAFEHPETFTIQTISIIPPENASADFQKEARRKADAALKLAKATKSYEEFGHLAEQISEDDWRVNLGDRKAVERANLPPEIVKAALAMKPGQVSDLVQLGRAYAIFRLNAHQPAGKTSFLAAKGTLQSNMEKEKVQLLRSALGDRLRKSAKIEVM